MLWRPMPIAASSSSVEAASWPRPQNTSTARRSAWSRSNSFVRAMGTKLVINGLRRQIRARPRRERRGLAERDGQPMLAPRALSAAGTGWKKVSPPEEQSPLPPEVRPSAVLPSNRAPPLSPGSAHTFVSMSPLTVPSEYVTDASVALTVPPCTWVVLPLRWTDSPTVALPAPLIACVEPLYRSTSLGCAALPVYVAIE